MGSLQAREMRGYLKEEALLCWHLQSNHYPPLSLLLVPVARKAMQLAREERWEDEIDMPEGIQFRDGSRKPTVYDIVETMHLADFIENEDGIENEVETSESRES